MPYETIQIGTVNREQLLELLAQNSHEMWLAQREQHKGIKPTEAERAVTDHDRERAASMLALLESLHTIGALRFELLETSQEVPQTSS